MARKTKDDLLSARDVLREEFSMVAKMKRELADEFLAEQDTETQAAISEIQTVLAKHATGEAKIGRVSEQINREELEDCLRYLAVEVAKDMAIAGLRVGNLKLPENVCAFCGREV